MIADPSVSTTHAKLQRKDDVWVLTDLGSTNGTFVEGEPVTGETALTPGTTLRFGDVAALFEPHDEPASGSARPADPGGRAGEPPPVRPKRSRSRDPAPRRAAADPRLHTEAERSAALAHRR